MTRKPGKTETPGVRSSGRRFQAYTWQNNKFVHVAYRDTEQQAADALRDYKLANPPRKPGRPKKDADAGK